VTGSGRCWLSSWAVRLPDKASLRFLTLNEWLAWQESLHPRSIDLGLDRVAAVAGEMGLPKPAPTVIVVAGTNGKGSCVAMLERLLLDAGFRTGAYTSPHLLRYNERIRICGKEVEDEALCAAFQRVDDARAEVSLSYFEFGTLAALDLFGLAELEVAILEVGLGGRLDAVNMVDADISLITRVSLDHQDWLGSDRESIGREKAGILRPDRPGVCVDRDPPRSLLAHAQAIGSELLVLGRDFDWQDDRQSNDDRWAWKSGSTILDDLPAPGIPGVFQRDNASAVLMVVHRLKERMRVDAAGVARSLATVTLAGRQQRLRQRRQPGVELVFDVAHNPDAVRALFGELGRPGRGRQYSVFACMADKDVEGMVANAMDAVDAWKVTTFDDPRALGVKAAAASIRAVRPDAEVREHARVRDALEAALDEAAPGDRVVVFGSFRIVAEAMEQDI